MSETTASTALTVPSRHATLPERLAARSVIERVALTEGMEAMRAEGWQGAYRVLSHYAGAYERLTANTTVVLVDQEPQAEIVEPHPEPMPVLVDPLEPDEPEVTSADEALAEAIVKGPDKAAYLVGKDGVVHSLAVVPDPEQAPTADPEAPVVDSVDETAMEEGLRRTREDASVVQFPTGKTGPRKPRRPNSTPPRQRRG